MRTISFLTLFPYTLRLSLVPRRTLHPLYLAKKYFPFLKLLLQKIISQSLHSLFLTSIKSPLAEIFHDFAYSIPFFHPVLLVISDSAPAFFLSFSNIFHDLSFPLETVCRLLRLSLKDYAL